MRLPDACQIQTNVQTVEFYTYKFTKILSYLEHVEYFSHFRSFFCHFFVQVGQSKSEVGVQSRGKFILPNVWTLNKRKGQVNFKLKPFLTFVSFSVSFFSNLSTE